MKKIMVLGVVLLCASFASTAMAAKCVGVSLPDSVEVGGEKLVLNGLGIREATMLQVDVYVAGLYLKAKTKDGGQAAGNDEPKQLMLKFVRDVAKADIAGAWTEGFDKNAKADKAALAPRTKKLNSWMMDMKVGDEMVFTYTPAKGLEVSVKGQVKGVIEGADFMKVFYSIWLGPQPPNPGLRKGLLGGACE